jgi:putative transferase (TIGR04331 family)
VISWNKDLVAEGLEEIAHAQVETLVAVKTIMDAYHEWEKPTQYYDVLMGDWILHFTHQVYIARKELELSSEVEPLIPVPVFADQIEFLTQCVETVNFQKQLQSTLKGLYESTFLRTLQFTRDSATITNRRRESLLGKCARWISTSTPQILVTDPYVKCSRLMWARALIKWRGWVRWDNIAYPIRVVANLNSEWRIARAAVTPPENTLIGSIRALLPIYMPVVFLEGFSSYRKQVLAFPIARPRATYTAQSLHTHLAWKFLIAEWKEKGTLLLNHQHGGGYGIDRVHAIEEFEERVADRFYTFGWSTKKTSTIQLGQPSLQTPVRKRTRVLLSCMAMPKNPYRLHFQPMPGTIENVHGETKDFLLSLINRKHLLIRPDTTDYGWGNIKVMQDTVPGVEIDNRKKTAAYRFAESKLVIHNSLGTGWLETLSLDIPTLCFYEPRAYAFRASAQEYIDALEAVGIVHRSGRTAAQFINLLDDNIDQWWNKSEVQKARQDFVDRYANYSNEWIEHWENEFKSVLKLV